MVQKYKQLQSIYNLMHGLEQVPTGVMKKQANLCISGTNFTLIKTEYLKLFMGFKNQKQKHVFPETLKGKTLFPSKKCNYEIIIN